MTAPVTVVATPATRTLARRMVRAVLGGDAAGEVALGMVPDVHPRQALALVVSLLNEARACATAPHELESGLLAAWESRVGVEASVREHVTWFAAQLIGDGVVRSKADEMAEVQAMVCRACRRAVPRLEARHLCKSCYVQQQRAGTLDRFPPMRTKSA